ncbi:hypothetical protein CRM22_009103 [Opisthorchis felineus]|uniref:TFIIS N-terminal domain-containing protein n=1 Tax=Opisthorchis felineus TaxID=147828 RepID=A0A4S2L900_OPIFE|nr:hypothetical protein CRM22_009103 [Opisthorchis felineus]
MHLAVMSNTLNSIMLLLRNGLDSAQNITNSDAVLDAVTQLETFPMTMGQLQDTRIGQLLQTIRHKVDTPLQKRIRFVIKAWQKLLSPEFACHSVIPLKCYAASHTPNQSSKGSDCQTSNGTPTKPSFRENMRNSQHFLTSAPVNTSDSRSNSPVVNFSDTTTRLKRPYHSLSGTTEPSAPITSFVTSHTEQPTTPSKRSRTQSNISPQPGTTKPTSCLPLVNGTRSVVPISESFPSFRPATSLGKTNTASIPLRDLGDQQSTEAQSQPKGDRQDTQNALHRLAKVKSTVELVQAAGDCIDSVTADRILTNRISKEPDPPRPSIVPQLAKTRQARTAPSTATSCKGSQPHDLRSSRPFVRHVDRETVHKPPSSISGPSSKPSLPAISSTETFSPQSHSAQPVDSVSSELLINGNNLGVPRVHGGDIERPQIDTDSDNQKSREKKRKKKRKHRHKHILVGPTVYNPVTNHLDDWPSLPALPAQIDWSSLDRPTSSNWESLSSIPDSADRLVSDVWPGINRTSDDEGNLRLLTDLYSLTIDDQYLHVLPWVDMIGFRRQFFPSSDDLDQLTQMPDPW